MTDRKTLEALLVRVEGMQEKMGDYTKASGYRLDDMDMIFESLAALLTALLETQDEHA